MNNRITLVTLFNDDGLTKINNALKLIDDHLCKVPFGRNVNRVMVDTLPYHFTLSAWNIKEKEFIIEQLSNISFISFKVIVDSIEIMAGKENSYVLYFNIKDNEKLNDLHKRIYKILPSEKYNPDNFNFHITIHIDKDYEKIIEIKKDIEINFIPFELEINCLGLFQIYPAKLITKINSK